MVLYSRKKRDRQVFGAREMSELRDEAVARVKAAVIDNAVYENDVSILRLSGWSSQEDAMLYEKSIVRVEGDVPERVHVERVYTKERRYDAPHIEPGRIQNSGSASAMSE